MGAIADRLRAGRSQQQQGNGLIFKGAQGVVNLPGVRAEERTKLGVELEGAPKKAQIEVGKQVSAQAAKAKEQMDRNSRTLSNKAINLVSAFKRLKKDTPTFEGFGPTVRNVGQSFAGKFQRSIVKGTGANPAIKAYNGLLDEISTAVGKMAAPSAKVGPDLIKVFRGTLPDIDSSWQEFADQLSFSLQNAEASRAAFSKEQYDPVKTQKEINKLLGQAMPGFEFVEFKKRVKDSLIVGNPETLPKLLKESGVDVSGDGDIDKINAELDAINKELGL